jgi:phytanoyl-CoA hydroxylase
MFDYASLRSAADRRAYYEEHGYVVIPGLVEPALCQEALRCFMEEVKPYRGYIYRQASANPERHRFTADGFMLNSILNPFSVSSRHFPRFRGISRRTLASDALYRAVEELYGEPATMVQSMYFEGNPATWAHQDCYYLDSDKDGALLGTWIALEDIHEEAGRFYIVPGSHRIDIGRNAAELNIATSHDQYKALVEQIMAERKLERRKPALRRGDVLIWSSRTIHGAERPSGPGHSRNSYTAHFIPSSTRFMQYQCIPLPINPVTINGHRVYAPKDQDVLANRMVFAVETFVPGLFQRLKKAAIARKLRTYAPATAR